VQPFDCQDPSIPKASIVVECGVGNIAINNQIGQTFVPTNPGLVEKIAVWIKPELYYVTEYQLELYRGEFETLIATSPVVSINPLQPHPQENREPGELGFYDFGLSAEPTASLVAGDTYSWMLVRKSEYSGAFSECGDVIDGVGYWLGEHPEPNHDYSFKLFTVDVPIETIVVDCGAGNIAINNKIGQSFVATSPGIVDKISVWIKPNLYYVTDYQLELYSGDFDTLLATSPIVSINELQPSSWENREPGSAGFHDFTLFHESQPMVAGETYSWMLVRVSQYSGAFTMCGDVIDGVGYWLGEHPEPNNDYSFKLFTWV